MLGISVLLTPSSRHVPITRTYFRRPNWTKAALLKSRPLQRRNRFNRVYGVLDTLGGGSVFTVFDLLSGLTPVTIHPDPIPLTAFCTLYGLYEWLHMPQGAADSPAWFISVMHLVMAGRNNIPMLLHDATDQMIRPSIM